MSVFKRFTEDLASLSKCSKRHVAAVITDGDLTQVYSIGINGGPKGLQDCLCNLDERYGCNHAELNALVKNTSIEQHKIMFITLSPCKLCATAIINAPGSFRAVYYFNEWKDDTGIKLLKAAGIYVLCI